MSAHFSVQPLPIELQKEKGIDRRFWSFIAFATIASYFIYPYPDIARWVGFFFAAYAAVANDSIQTLGTFIASNRKRNWWSLWLFVGGVFLATVTYSWVVHSGDVTFERLASKGFEKTPTKFKYLQIVAPLILIVLTRLKMPVSTTFLLLTSFSTEAAAVGKVLNKSLTGYVLAFGIAMVVWLSLNKVFEHYFKGEASSKWTVFQWLTSGTLWSVWIMQDAANIAVYLPRQLNVFEFITFAGTVFIGLGFLFKKGGARIQEVVEEKSNVVDVRSASMIDFIYAIILFYFKLHNKIPMSTTWVFLGLLGGRELAMSIKRSGIRSPKAALKLIVKDAGMAGMGLLISFGVALAVNDSLLESLLPQ